MLSATALAIVLEPMANKVSFMTIPTAANTVFQIVMFEKRRPINACEL